MSNLVTEARHILASNKTVQASKDFMSTEQRDALAEDFASKKQFLSASHFHSDAEKRKDFEELFWKKMTPIN